ncbi:phage major capsid protein [Fictibacillus sp. 23RED33]|uniref:phage major capsid protein n=1 Tax=Fictibacillus sp. 23RED33 TaxID=2745879 RepID=UPI0018CF67D6|nr:phage major capsid protein [Fictibacillus sp. 23RED33]MBH0174718.1 phage major capsid protein [Fictibacillus sp. 23RED33]
MSLKQLMLGKKIEQRKSTLADLMIKEEGFATRSKELENALSEAKTDEEINTVEESITTLENEQKDVDEKKSTLESEIEDLEKELEDLNTKAPSNTENRSANQQQSQTRSEAVVGMKVNKGFFKGMERSAAMEMVKREEVKTFLTNIRERSFKTESMQMRAVEGGNLGIPDVILGLIRDNLHRYSKLISKVNLKPLGGTSRMNIVGDIPEAVWTEACASLNELDLKFYQLQMDGYKVGGYIPVCNAQLEDSDFNLGSEVFDALGQAIGLAVDKAILYGTGVKMPVGIVTRLAETAKPSYWGNNERTWANLSSSNVGQVTGDTPAELFANLIRKSGNAKANYGNGSKFWAMNETTFTELQAQLVTFNAAGAIVASVNNSMPIIGGDIEILPFMKDGDIVGGYGSHYILAERAGSTFAVSEHVQFIQDNTVYKGTARYDGRPISGNGFVAMNIMGAAPATSVTFAPDEANEATPEV